MIDVVRQIVRFVSFSAIIGYELLTNVSPLSLTTISGIPKRAKLADVVIRRAFRVCIIQDYIVPVIDETSVVDMKPMKKAGSQDFKFIIVLVLTILAYSVQERTKWAMLSSILGQYK